MALQMQNALSGNVAEFGRFDLVQSVLACTKPVEHIITGGVARMNCGALIPVPTVYFDVVGHVELYVSSAKVVQGARHVFQIHRKAIAFNAVQESVQYGLSGTADILVNMKVHLIALTLVASLLASQATAQNAPAALRGKSVVASWTEVRLQRLGGIGEFTERSVSHTFSAYISSEGRVFAKRTVYSSGSGRRHGTGSRSSVGENSGGAQQAQIRGQSYHYRALHFRRRTNGQDRFRSRLLGLYGKRHTWAGEWAGNCPRPLSGEWTSSRDQVGESDHHELCGPKWKCVWRVTVAGYCVAAKKSPDGAGAYKTSVRQRSVLGDDCAAGPNSGICASQ
jgi:hypothetical protein